jgi:hypothetical protein
MIDTPETDALNVAHNLADSAMWEADRRRGQLWKARDRAWKLARERNHWKRDCLEQCKLLAMSADREEKLRMELQQARDCFSAAMELAERYKTERDAIP